MFFPILNNTFSADRILAPVILAAGLTGCASEAGPKSYEDLNSPSRSMCLEYISRSNDILSDPYTTLEQKSLALSKETNYVSQYTRNQLPYPSDPLTVQANVGLLAAQDAVKKRQPTLSEDPHILMAVGGMLGLVVGFLLGYVIIDKLLKGRDIEKMPLTKYYGYGLVGTILTLGLMGGGAYLGSLFEKHDFSPQPPIDVAVCDTKPDNRTTIDLEK